MVKRYALVAVALLAGLAPAAARADVDVTVNPAAKHQVIHGFGSCLINLPTINRPDFQKQYVEDLGVTVIRIGMEARICKEVASVNEIKWQNFDWNRNVQLPAAAACLKLNPKEIVIIGSMWTPPHWMKQGAHLQYGDESCGGSLREDRIPHFARFMAQYVLGIKEKFGFDLYALSIQNELEFNEPYMSCVYTPDLYLKAVKAVGAEFEKAGIKTLLMGPETMTDFLDRNMNFIRPLMNDPKGKTYLSFFCSHGYTDGIRSEGGHQSNSALWNAVKGYGKELWMTETSGESQDWRGGLSLAGKIHNGLVYGNVSAWVYWATSDMAANESLTANGVPTPKWWASKHYYRFIRPGSVRIDAGPDGSADTNVSAYLNEKDGTMTIVLLNRSGSAVRFNLSVKGGPASAAWETYRSSQNENCAKLANTPSTGGKLSVELPASTLVTLYSGKLKPVGSAPAASTK